MSTLKLTQDHRAAITAQAEREFQFVVCEAMAARELLYMLAQTAAGKGVAPNLPALLACPEWARTVGTWQRAATTVNKEGLIQKAFAGLDDRQLAMLQAISSETLVHPVAPGSP